MSRMRTALAGMAAAALVITACGGDEGGSDETQVLDFYNDKAQWEDAFVAVGEESAESIGIELEPVGYSDSNDYSAFIRASFRTAEAPELFTWHTGGQLEDLVAEGLVDETTDLWDEAVEAGQVPEDLRQYYTVDGAQYCMPLNAGYWVMYYNTSVFDEHGITPPETWDELMAAADTLLEGGQTPFYHTAVLFNFVWFQQLLVGQDPGLYEALSTGDASYTDPGVVAVMEQWRDLIEGGYFNDPGVQTDPNTMLDSGEVAMAMFGTWFSGNMHSIDAVAGEDFDFFIIPNVDPDLPETSLIVETGPICSAADAPNLEAGREFLSWWVGADAQTAFANARGDMSFNPDAAIDDESLRNVAEAASTDDHRLLNRYFEAAPPPVLNAALDGFGGFVANPGDPLPVLEAIQSAAEEYWSEQ